jgi:tRNA pseudouridine38-40 synthase
MAHYKLILAYDGTDFFGFQRQGKTRTVQFVLENALALLGWKERTILAAGRTDTGVHASGQVIGFQLNWAHSTEALAKALNANLPDDVAVQDIREVDEGFHPRYQALSRTYRYCIYCRPDRDPLIQRFAWRVWPPVQLTALQGAAQLLSGKHDFSAFGTPPRTNGTTVRTVFQTMWEQQSGCLFFEVTADAFLYHMVRRMVYLQVMVARSRISQEDLADAIRDTRELIPGLAPPNGLTLVSVRY